MSTATRQTAWALVDRLSERDAPLAATYDRFLRDLEDEYVDQAVWEQMVTELREVAA